jgi:AcrR family transcriptional regulator
MRPVLLAVGERGARASIQGIRKAELLEATKRCIAQRGLAGTTLRDVAEYAGTTASSVLYYFESKEELILAAIADASDELRIDVEKQLPEKRSAFEKLETIIRLTLMSSSTAWRLWLEIRAQSVRESFVRATYFQKYEEWVALVRRVIQEGIDSGELSAINAEALATVVSAGVDGIAFYLLMDPGADRQQTADWCVDFLRRLVLDGPRSSRSAGAQEAGSQEST